MVMVMRGFTPLLNPRLSTASGAGSAKGVCQNPASVPTACGMRTASPHTGSGSIATECSRSGATRTNRPQASPPAVPRWRPASVSGPSGQYSTVMRAPGSTSRLSLIVVSRWLQPAGMFHCGTAPTAYTH